jgi:cation diffusion facilitator CzcD-associated flavoprotein CzcO
LRSKRFFEPFARYRRERMQEYDAIIIGAGHNGLILGNYLQKAGLKTLILERRLEVWLSS